jgi:hypothetical protein
MILIEVNAIRRSGHHAFINWLISNIHGVAYKENLCKYKFNTILGNKNIVWVNEGEDNTEGCIQYISDKKHQPIVIISYEVPRSITMNNPNFSILTDKLRQEWGVTEHIQVPFVRDYYNNMASLNKAWPIFNNIHSNTRNLYLAYNHLYKGQLKRALNTFRGVIYDKWVSDEEYANEVCLKLIGKPNKFSPLEIGGTFSSYGDGKLKIESLLNRYKKAEWPQWVKDEISGDEELSKLIKQAGFDKSDIEIQEK